MPELPKCLRSDCLFEINPNPKNNDGTHCCKACMNNRKHGLKDIYYNIINESCYI
jgi:hypothetical protein